MHHTEESTNNIINVFLELGGSILSRTLIETKRKEQTLCRISCDVSESGYKAKESFITCYMLVQNVCHKNKYSELVSGNGQSVWKQSRSVHRSIETLHDP